MLEAATRDGATPQTGARLPGTASFRESCPLFSSGDFGKLAWGAGRDRSDDVSGVVVFVLFWTKARLDCVSVHAV